MPDTIETETKQEAGQQVDLADPRVQAHVQQAVAAANANLEKNRDAIKSEKTVVEQQRDAYTAHGTADEIGQKLKELEELKQVEAAKNAQTTPDVLKAEVDKQVAFQMAQHETRMGDVYKAQTQELETFKGRAEQAETDSFESWLWSELLEASVDPKTQIFRDGAGKLILKAILPFAKRIQAGAEGLPDEVRLMVNGTILSGGLPDGQMGLRELLKLGRRPPSEGKPTVLPGVNLSWYYPDDGAATESHVPDGETFAKSDWGKMSEEQKMDLTDSDPAAAKKLIRANGQRQKAA